MIFINFLFLFAFNLGRWIKQKQGLKPFKGVAYDILSTLDTTLIYSTPNDAKHTTFLGTSPGKSRATEQANRGFGTAFEAQGGAA
jgi:hypothetical protein